MTVNDACKKFGVNKDYIRKLCKESCDGNIKYINAVKLNGKWIIRDETKIIMTKSQISNVLFQMLRFKNNPNSAIARDCFPDDDTLLLVVEYIYELGLITKNVSIASNLEAVFSSVMLTDKGFNWFINVCPSKYNDIGVQINNNLNVGLTSKVGLVNF